MNDTELNDLLEKLHHQIEHTQSLTPEQQEHLHQIEGDIRELLDRSSTQAAKSQPDILQQLEDAVAIFEISHPTIAVTFTKLMAVLSNAGI